MPNAEGAEGFAPRKLLVWANAPFAFIPGGAPGKGTLEGFGGPALGMLSAGRSDVEAFVAELVVLGVEVAPKSNGFGAGAADPGCCAGFEAVDVGAENRDDCAPGAAGAGAAGAAGAAVVGRGWSGEGGAPAASFIFALSFSIAAASRSCFSHFEYVRETRIDGVSDGSPIPSGR